MIEPDLDTEVIDELVDKICAKFELSSPLINSLSTSQSIENKDTLTSHISSIEQDKDKSVIVETNLSVSQIKETGVVYAPDDEISPEIILNAELICVPKIALPGLKVVGKIELPIPHSMQMTEEDGVMISNADLAQSKRSSFANKKK